MVVSFVIKNKVLVICTTIIALLFIIAIFAPWLAPNNPTLVNLSAKLQGPSATYPLGTDHLGRCILSRLLIGMRVSLGSAALIFLCSLFIGLVIGTLAGYFGGWLDYILMRVCDTMMAFPNLLLVIGFVGMFGPGLKQVVIALIIVQWVYYARIFRGMVVSLKTENFVTAAHINGSSSFKIIKKHIVPNIIPPLLVMSTLEMGWSIMNMSSMSFLGLGVQAPKPEWGAMILEGKSFVRSNVELMLYPGLCIMFVVIIFNLLGESLSKFFGVKKQYRGGKE
ncbi:nickel ABC transporter permease subunit NikC [Heyndrickxia sp. NPDC080065]|uniref:nickel ABC transporter permease subunit NikC n=1 Tax=Heyndrickxia sp. NPDC080065 TaxID=3390568 RepID=UPI003D0863CC